MMMMRVKTAVNINTAGDCRSRMTDVKTGEIGSGWLGVVGWMGSTTSGCDSSAGIFSTTSKGCGGEEEAGADCTGADWLSEEDKAAPHIKQRVASGATTLSQEGQRCTISGEVSDK